MMHDRRKSDGLVLPAKPSNKAVDAVAGAVEGRGPGKGNAASETRPGRSAGLASRARCSVCGKSHDETSGHGSPRCFIT